MDKIMMMMCQKAMIEKEKKEKLQPFNESQRNIPEVIEHEIMGTTEQNTNVQPLAICSQTVDRYKS